MNKSTEKLQEVFEKAKSESDNQQKVVPVEVDLDSSKNENDDNRTKMIALLNIAKSKPLVKETLGSLMRSCNCLGIEFVEAGRVNILSIRFQTLGADKTKTNVNVFEFSYEIYKALFPTGYTGKKRMILMF